MTDLTLRNFHCLIFNDRLDALKKTFKNDQMKRNLDEESSRDEKRN